MKKHRLIDANELVDAICRSDELLHSTQWETDEIVDQIDRIPTVDAVEVVHGRWVLAKPRVKGRNELIEVVRCKDCKHRTLDFFGGHCCKLHKGLAMVTDESFCCYGERKDNG